MEQNIYPLFRLNNMLTSDEGGSGSSSTQEGKRLAAMLLRMLDERDHR